MPEATPRKFTMADLMILIAGCAVAIVTTRVVYNDFIGPSEDWDPSLWKLRLSYRVPIPAPSLASISLAVLICRLRQPRPKLRLLLRQPGTMAITCAFLVLVLEGTTLLAGRGLNLLIDRIWPPISIPAAWRGGPPGTMAMLLSNTDAGEVTAACWLLLLAVGRWRPEPSWIDRSGRCLGACWIAIDVASSVASTFSYY